MPQTPQQRLIMAKLNGKKSAINIIKRQRATGQISSEDFSKKMDKVLRGLSDFELIKLKKARMRPQFFVEKRKDGLGIRAMHSENILPVRKPRRRRGF